MEDFGGGLRWTASASSRALRNHTNISSSITPFGHSDPPLTTSQRTGHLISENALNALSVRDLCSYIKRNEAISSNKHQTTKNRKHTYESPTMSHTGTMGRLEAPRTSIGLLLRSQSEASSTPPLYIQMAEKSVPPFWGGKGRGFSDKKRW